MNFKSFFTVTTIALVLTACSSSIENRTSQELLSAYLNDNKQVILFGKIDVKSILEKADYKNIPKVNVLLIEEMKQYESALEFDQGVHFALEGTLTQDDPNAKVFGFVKVKHADSLSSKIASLGYIMSESKGMKFVQNNDVSIGIKDGMAIFMTKQGKYDGKAELKSAFEKCSNDLSGGKVDDILNQEGDIIVALSYENIYHSSEEIIKVLEKDKKKELLALVTDSYSYGAVKFEKGQLTVNSKNLLSSEMMNRMMMKEDPSAAIVQKLGKGKPKLGLAFNIDALKYDLLINDFYPNVKSELSKISFQVQMAMSTLGENFISSLWNGKLGLVLVGDAIKDGSFVPEINFHLGLGKKGKVVSDMLSAFTGAMPKNADGSVSFNGMAIKMNDKEITAYTEKGNATSSSLVLPDFASNFGKKGMSFFIDLDGLDMKSLDVDDEAKFIYAIKNVYMEADNSGGKMVIKGKNPNQNILKQMLDVYVDDIKKKVGMLN